MDPGGSAIMRNRSIVVEKEIMPPIKVRRWTREEYEKMIDAGIFPPETRAELVEGAIYNMTPQKSRHATAIRAAEEALRSAFALGYDVRTQLPIALSPSSEPEPDIAVAPGSWRDYVDAHPSSAVLIVEIADTSLEYDRHKGRVYARSGIEEYWIVNLADRWVEVYGDPSDGVYRFSKRFMPGEIIVPRRAPDASISVADLLP
jgi:Uma2 family endonuclease